MNFTPEQQVVILAALITAFFGSFNVSSVIIRIIDHFRDRSKLKQDEPSAESIALEGAARTVKISAETLENRFKELENKIRDQEKHLEFADQTIAELKEKLQEMESEQKRYRAFVKSLATELLAELNRNGSVDLKILKHIVSKLLDGKDNENEHQ